MNDQLLKMLLIQVITILITIGPFVVYRVRASFTSNNVKSQYELAQDNLFLQTATVLSLISNSISFYLFTLSGIIFRRELLRILSNCLQVLLHTLNAFTNRFDLLDNRIKSSSSSLSEYPRLI